MLLFVKQLLFLSPSGISVEFYMLYYPNFSIDFLIIFPVVRVTHFFTADFFFLVTLHKRRPINQLTSIKWGTAINIFFFSWKKYVLSQKKGLQKGFSAFLSKLLKKKIVLKIIFTHWNFWKYDMVKHELRVKSFKARVEIQKCEFKSMSYKSKSTSYEFKSTNH